MIRAVASAERLIQRLRVRSARIAAARADAVRRETRRQSSNWRSAAALWPDLFGGDANGK